MAEKKSGKKKGERPVPKAAPPPPPKYQLQYYSSPNQMYAVVLFAAAVLILALTFVRGSSGWLMMHQALKGFFGMPLLVMPFALGYIAVILDRDEKPQKLAHRVVSLFGCTTLLSGFIEIMFGKGRLQNMEFEEALKALYEEGVTWGGGGMVSIVAYPMQRLLGDAGSKITICLLLFVSVMFLLKKGLSDIGRLFSNAYQQCLEFLREEFAEEDVLEEYDQEELEEEVLEERAERELLELSKAQAPQPEPEPFMIDIPMEPQPPLNSSLSGLNMPAPEPITGMSHEEPPEEDGDPELEAMIRNATSKSKKKSKEDERLEAMLEIADEVAQQAGSSDLPYRMPRLEFLERGRSHANDPGTAAEMHEKAEKLKEVLESFNVQAKITNISRGPSVTRYEVQPAAGVKVARIKNLESDIALNFAAEGVRIEAPIPGKPAVGIEVPNAIRDTVSLREMLEAPEFMESRSKLSFAVGKDIAGNVIIGDIANMPHMIIAGATGSGKSICTNAIIMSILYHAAPDEVKLILIDPKIVEFRVYDGIPHLLIPVVTDPKKAAGALNWAVQEMQKRYEIFSECTVHNLEEYNELCDSDPEMERMPQIVICIDELAELMMTASKEVEDAICRLAQLARAAGMHLIIATQRPTTNIITGLIKANIPSRIALSVKSQIDSRVILDVVGAEKLLGKGDMLYLPNGQTKPMRVQGCYVSMKEIKSVVDFVKEQSASEYDERIIQAVDLLTVNTPEDKAAESDSIDGQMELDEDQQIIEQAIDIVVACGQASTSNLQRRLRLGYGRAARIMDELERMGIIGPYEGAKPRRVLITKEQLDERRLRNMK